jgi:hypothetical protein
MSSFLIDSAADQTTTIVTQVTEIKSELIIGTGGAGTTYTMPTEKAPGLEYTLYDPTGTGQLEWVSIPAGAGPGTPAYSFKTVSDAGTVYTVVASDQVVEITSDTYTQILLPSATGNAGRYIVFSRKATNDNLRLVAGGLDLIDGQAQLYFPESNTRLGVLSNGTGEWYIY